MSEDADGEALPDDGVDLRSDGVGVRPDGVDVRPDGADLELGVIGVSEGNGHPYSFSAVVNGYDDAGMAASGWDVIHDYVREKDPSEFGFPGVAVTHAWTQDPAETERLCAAARIPNAVAERERLVDAVDAVLLLRDDHETHADLAAPFLEAGVPAFVDKPLAVDVAELRSFRPHLESGLVTSCSGMRFARELDGPRASLEEYGDVRLARGTVIEDWSAYGVHVLDAIFGVLDCRPTAVSAVDGEHASVTVETDGSALVEVDALGADAAFAFDVDLYGTEAESRHRLRDNFRAFRRTLWRFVRTVRTGEPQIPPEATLDVLRTIVAGRRAMETGERVAIDEIDV